jgi:hypothetical protein
MRLAELRCPTYKTSLEQYKHLIKPALLKLGYEEYKVEEDRFDKLPYIIINVNRNFGIVSNVSEMDSDNYNRYVVYNAGAFLYIATLLKAYEKGISAPLPSTSVTKKNTVYISNELYKIGLYQYATSLPTPNSLLLFYGKNGLEVGVCSRMINTMYLNEEAFIEVAKYLPIYQLEILECMDRNGLSEDLRELLLPGRSVTTRSNIIYTVIEYRDSRYLLSLKRDTILSINNYNRDLERISGNSCRDNDIVKVVESSDVNTLIESFREEKIEGVLIWERPEEVELTMDEIAAKFNIPVEQLKIKK